MTALQPLSFMAGNFGMCVSRPGQWHKGHQGVLEVSKHLKVVLEDGAGQGGAVPGVYWPSTC